MKTPRILRSILLTACLSTVAPIFAHAENCAWLNAATAGGLLGTEASVKTEPIPEHLTPGQVSARQITNPHPDATCTFLPQQAASGAQLALAVHTMANIPAEYPAYAAACSKDPLPLRAVGNEAVECSSHKGSLRVETVISRIRDRAFILTWTIPNPETGTDALPQEAVREKLRNIAEQIAGSMF